MECLDGCDSPFDSDLCIRCLYNRIQELLDDPAIPLIRVAAPNHRYLLADDAADLAYDRMDREFMHNVLGMLQRGGTRALG